LIVRVCGRILARNVPETLPIVAQTASTAVTRFTRQDLARILRLPARQIASWQRSGLMQIAESYTFEDLSHLRRLREICAARISARNIRNSVSAMQRMVGTSNPLREASPIPRGSRLVFRHSGMLVDPQTHQLVFDFELAGKIPSQMVATRRADIEYGPRVAQQAQEMFLRAVQKEEDAATVAEAAELYREVLRIQPKHAASSINLGTILYNQREFAEAEQRYRYATEVDPFYALAFFDLGNVLDELQRLPEAIVAYQRAIALVPEYADAHYNLALAYERQGQRRKALKYWQAYVRLDPVGPWATHARTQARRILASEKLSIVCRRGQKAG
jgi:tetratricopeptide (TPR) repeat protein